MPWEGITLILASSSPSGVFKLLHWSEVLSPPLGPWQDRHYVNVCANPLVSSCQLSDEAGPPPGTPHFPAMGPRAREICSLIVLLQVLAESAENSEFYLAGDYLLGGLFTLHANVKGIVHLNFLQVPQCKE